MAMGVSSSSQSPFRPFSHTHLPFSSSSSSSSSSRRFYVAAYGRALCRKEVYSIKSAPYTLFAHSKFGCPFQFRTLCYHPWKSPRGEGSFNASTDSPKVVSAMLEWSKKMAKDAGVVPHSVVIKESLSSWKAAATRLRDEKRIYQGNITPAYTSNQVFADTQMTKASPETVDKAVACSQLPDNLDDVSHNSCTQSYTIQREIEDVAEERINGFSTVRVPVMKEVSKLKKHGPERNRDAETIESIEDVAEERINGFPSERVAVTKEVSTLKKHSPERNRDTETIESNADLKSRTTHHLQEKLDRVYDKVLVVDNMSIAEEVVSLLTTKYKNLVHACDTEVSSIDVKKETPVDHGEIICFSIYSGPNADFGKGKSCVWVDVLDGGGKELLDKFSPFFEDPSIKKVWHNYSFDNHIIENYGMKLSGFHADTMHMARLWDSSRRTLGGYSLEALTGDQKVMSDAKLGEEEDLIGKISMKNIFGRRKLKKDGSEGKIVTIAPVESLQREERRSWISYSALDAITTQKLYESLRHKLSNIAWIRDGVPTEKSMFGFYEEYWRPFGELLVRMETEGMLVDRAYLAQLEKVAKAEQELAVSRFRNWASKYCPDAKYMNVGSDTQLRQFLFGGMINSKNQVEVVPSERIFKVPNTDNVVEEGKKSPSKYRNIKLQGLSCHGIWLPAEKFTATGWPSVSGDSLKALAGKVSVDYDFTDDLLDDGGDESADETLGVQLLTTESDLDVSAYGKAYGAFGGGLRGREACHAIASLCEVCSIDSLISNFILPLQGCNVSGRNGRVHCSLNINTETGRLSARRPNLQNQPALEKDRYKIRQAFVAAPGKSLIVADYGQLELRILAHLADCKSMMDAFRAGGDFHSRTAMNMYPHICEAVDKRKVLLEWHPQPGEDKPPVPLLKDAFASERRKAKMLNFSIAYGKTPVGLARDWKVSVEEARKTVDLWYGDRKEVLDWQEGRKKEALDPKKRYVLTLLGRARRFPLVTRASRAQRGHIERAAINTPVQGSAADVAMCAMLEISRNKQLKELGWKLLLQVHDEVILEGPSESAEVAKSIVVECMSKPFNGKNVLKVDLSVDAKCAQNWYAAK